MGKIVDFQCTYDNAVGISGAVTEKLNLTFPDAYLHWNTMAKIALEIKRQEDVCFCELPFCHTLEAEAMGGIVNLGDALTGPRAKEYICETPEDILALPEIDYEKGRISETLKACKYLREQGENVVLLISGPFTILNVLMDARLVFRFMRKTPDKMQQVFDKFAEELLRFIEKAVDNQVNIISYADSSGGLNIIGPKNTEYMMENFTYPFLERAEKIVAGKAQIFLCPKISFALLGTEKMRWKDIPVEESMRYVDAALSVKEQAPIVGQMCIKNTGFRVQKEIKAVELV